MSQFFCLTRADVCSLSVLSFIYCFVHRGVVEQDCVSSSGSLLFGTRVHTCFGSLLLDLFEVSHLGLVTNESFFELSGAR